MNIDMFISFKKVQHIFLVQRVGKYELKPLVSAALLHEVLLLPFQHGWQWQIPLATVWRWKLGQSWNVDGCIVPFLFRIVNAINTKKAKKKTKQTKENPENRSISCFEQSLLTFKRLNLLTYGTRKHSRFDLWNV